MFHGGDGNGVCPSQGWGCCPDGAGGAQRTRWDPLMVSAQVRTERPRQLALPGGQVLGNRLPPAALLESIFLKRLVTVTEK